MDAERWRAISRLFHEVEASALWRLAISGGEPVKELDVGDVSLGLTASSDGRTILYTRLDSSVDDLMMVDGFR